NPGMFGQLPSTFLMVGAQSTLYYIGRYFLVRQLYRDYDIRSTHAAHFGTSKLSSLGVQVAFSTTFSFSGGLCLLMLFEILELMPE
ncbi:hypothetical protein L0F63_003064, partial [Massospora cicadina]